MESISASLFMVAVIAFLVCRFIEKRVKANAGEDFSNNPQYLKINKIKWICSIVCIVSMGIFAFVTEVEKPDNLTGTALAAYMFLVNIDIITLVTLFFSWLRVKEVKSVLGNNYKDNPQYTKINRIKWILIAVFIISSVVAVAIDVSNS